MDTHNSDPKASTWANTRPPPVIIAQITRTPILIDRIAKSDESLRVGVQVSRPFVIPVGSYFTGEMQWLTLINGHDVSNPTGESQFRNVRVYEAGAETGGEGSALVYLHTDHLGTVVKATDEAQNVVWDAVRKPFGERTVDVAEVAVLLGFPGQYYDEETNNYYNYFRDYDPTTGRYLQSDPIGLKGGLNTYAYVDGNPLNKIDPLGLYGYRGTRSPGIHPGSGTHGHYEWHKDCNEDCKTSKLDCMNDCYTFFQPWFYGAGATATGGAAGYAAGGFGSALGSAVKVDFIYGVWVFTICSEACLSDPCAFDGS